MAGSTVKLNYYRFGVLNPFLGLPKEGKRREDGIFKNFFQKGRWVRFLMGVSPLGTFKLGEVWEKTGPNFGKLGFRRFTLGFNKLGLIHPFICAWQGRYIYRHMVRILGI